MAKGPTKAMWKRMLAVMIVLAFVMSGGLVAQLVNLQFVQSEFYQEKAISQQLAKTTVNANRGTIYDCNMKPLAESASVWTIGLSPVNVEDEEQRRLVADGLAEILDIDSETIYEKAGHTGTQYETLKSKIDRPVFEAVTEFVNDHDLTCVVIDPDTKRYYPSGDLASTLLGFTGTDNNGLYGLEAYYEKYLKGVPGRRVTAKNALGGDMNFNYETIIDPEDGSDLVLTIDSAIQKFLERSLETAVVENSVGNRAAGIVMNVKTGEILAMATKGDYDPNDPFTITDSVALSRLESLEGDELKAAKNEELNEQWRNKAVSFSYEPGSVFKSITAAMALEEGKVTADDTFVCTGGLKVEGWPNPIRCNNRNGHGTLTFVQGLQQSCNPVFMTVGARVGSELFYQYFSAFGFTEQTGIDLPGEGESIYHGEDDLNAVALATSSFGQTFKVTPIQMITAICAIANGGKLMTPYVVKEVVGADNNIIESKEPEVRRQVISEDTAKELCEMLESVVSEGGGKNAYIPGYHVAGKTGTSEKRDMEGDLRVASFCGFAPAYDPEVACIIILDEPHATINYGGTIAAPVAKDVLKDTLEYLNIEPNYTEEELASLDVSTPYVIGKSIADAEQEIRKKDLNVKIVGGGSTVVKQIPASGLSIPQSGMVVLYTDEESQSRTATVPNLVGMTLSEANRAATNAGLNIKLSGAGLDGGQAVSYKQDVDEGTEVPLGTIITVEFRENVEADGF